MGKKALPKKRIDSANIFLAPLIAVLLLCKWIGDIIILTSKAIILFEYKTYKNLKDSVKKVSATITTYEFPFFHTHTSSLAKEHVLFQSSSSPKKNYSPPLIKKYPALQIKFPRITIPRLPLYIQLWFLKLKYFFLGVIVVGLIALIFQLHSFVVALPNPAALTSRDIAATTKIYDRHGALLYEIYADQNRTPVQLSDIPKVMINATIATEDKDFYSHQGFSLSGIVRALLHNRNSDIENQEGGSTITQQLIRSAFLTPKKTLDRKIKELVLSIWAERIYSKNEILEMYLNQVPYGGTAWGVEAAAQTYFGKGVKDLSLAQAALIAGLPAAPSRYSPFGPHPEFAKQRQEDVLSRMVNNGYITKDQAEAAKNEKLEYKTPRAAIAAPHFVMYVKDMLEQMYGERAVESGGLRVTTSLDLGIQEMAQKAVSTQIDNLKNLSVGNGGALVTDPNTGEILAMVGSSDYFDQEHSGNVNVTLAERQPGSSIKVVNYAAALANGFTAATYIDDAPISFPQVGGPPYTPVNYDGHFHGRVTFRTALGSSFNIPAVKILNTIGVDKMITQGKKMGITSWDDSSRFGLSLTLGGGEVTMLEIAKVYGSLATEGWRNDLTPLLKVENYKGETLPLPLQHNAVRAVSPGVSYIMSNILADNVARTPAFGPNSALIIPGKTVSVKTGTSDNKRDNWTIGYTPDVVVSVWVGNNDGSPMNPLLTSGITGAAPIWQEIMTNILKDKTDHPLKMPQDVISIDCFGRKEFFILGTEPKNGCGPYVTFTPAPARL